MRELRDRLI
jgi:hypothetical protein